ncbi:hypothetical protein Pan258_38970 [Symmachiella dynata]|uniref:DUF2071 domain-containing protein n=1 Tax=Symmachiella dynata TaxID=2527995 RepID=UPI00118C5CE9|nr:DUF2071 domain-containing protein [Symmachiella dynata]QDT49842.1 hypothetical protein Pan258_38970 [Symmachiella dynata]
MQIPVVRGVIDRRILVNYRINPDVLATLLPAPFRPKLVQGHGIAGICLIRLKQLRPRFLPPLVGISSENAAHRMAVEWEDDGQLREGVYIPRRDTSSRFNTLAGGTIFPGLHHHAQFQVQENGDHYKVQLDSDDDDTHVAVEGTITETLPDTSIFESIAEVSDFFEAGSLGYSTTRKSNEFDGLELLTFNWHVQPLEISNVKSSFFEDPTLFPPGSVEFDCALLMTGIEHEWHGRPLMKSIAVSANQNH